MNSTTQTLLHYVVENDLPKARAAAKVLLQTNTTQKDKAFCERLLTKMEGQDAKGIEIPFNLKSIIQTRCTAYGFRYDRYYLTEREAEVIKHIKRMYTTGEKLAEIDIHYSNAVLLYGESGTGKTTFAQYVANELNLPFFYTSITQMIDSMMGKTGQNMDRVFEFASSLPCVLVLDEIDQIGTKRGEDSGVSGELKRVLISIMQSLDRLPNRVVLIAATNRPDALDDALVRRFPVKHEVQPLTEKESADFIRKYMDSVGLDWDGDPVIFLKDAVSKRNTTKCAGHYVPAAITDALNEHIAKAMEKAQENNAKVECHLGDISCAIPCVQKVDKTGIASKIIAHEYLHKPVRVLYTDRYDHTKGVGPVNTNIEDIIEDAFARKQIPDVYLWKENSRHTSPLEQALRDVPLSAIACPCCGKFDLRVQTHVESLVPAIATHVVGCDNCNWACPSEPRVSTGTTIDDFKQWLSAYVMLGMPEDRLHRKCAF